MTILDEALAQVGPWTPEQRMAVEAAARNWHTLTNRRDIWWCESHASLAPKPIGGLQGRCDRNLAGKAAPCRIVSVDALTVTAEEESEYEASFDPNYQQERR